MDGKKEARVRELFPGGNTAHGFYSFYDQIIPPEARRIFVIKGGPGVGKSSFMRAIARELIGDGFDAELLHCSSDNGSLDGVVFPEIQVALIDGTAPHVLDPRNPGCVDEILHLGDYWDEQGMVRAKTEIMALNREVGLLFARAYRFLRAAKEIRDAWSASNAEGLRTGLANRRAADLIGEIFGGRTTAETPGGERRLFASAITPEGPRHFLGTIFGDVPRLYVLRGEPGTGKSTLLRKVAQAGVERGFYAETYWCGFDPLRMEHVLFPELGVGLVTSTPWHAFGADRPHIALEMGECLAPETAEANASRNISDASVFTDLVGRGVACIRQAKTVHDHMERYYVPNMNFPAVDALRTRITARIRGYAGRPAAAAEG